MKDRIVEYLCALFAILLAVSCYDRDITNGKEFNHFMPPAENVTPQDADNSVTLPWTVSKNIPKDTVRPARIEIQAVENGIHRQKVTLGEIDPSHVDIKVETGRPYRFITGMANSIRNENRVKGESDQIYSKSIIVSR